MLSFHVKFVQTGRRTMVKQYAPDLSIWGHKKEKKKKKLLILSKFLYFPPCFLPFRELSAIYIKFRIVLCSFALEESKIFVWKFIALCKLLLSNHYVIEKNYNCFHLSLYLSPCSLNKCPTHSFFYICLSALSCKKCSPSPLTYIPPTTSKYGLSGIFSFSCIDHLTLSQTTNLRLFQTETVCRRQFQI